LESLTEQIVLYGPSSAPESLLFKCMYISKLHYTFASNYKN